MGIVPIHRAVSAVGEGGDDVRPLADLREAERRGVNSAVGPSDAAVPLVVQADRAIVPAVVVAEDPAGVVGALVRVVAAGVGVQLDPDLQRQLLCAGTHLPCQAAISAMDQRMVVAHGRRKGRC